MIRTTNLTPAKRRIAVVDVPRPQQTRLGVIRAGMPAQGRANAGWTPLTWQTPDSSQGWMADITRRQSYARDTTPGTYSYTPANNTPAANVAPWNSWLQPNCGDGSATPGATTDQGIGDATAAVQPPLSKLWLAIGLLGAAASGVYLLKSATGGK